MRFRVLSTMLLLASVGTAGPAQAAQCVMLRIRVLQDDSIHEISTPEGKRAASVQIKDGNEYPTFVLDLAVRDLASGLVSVTVRNRESGRTVDEFDLRVDAGEMSIPAPPLFALAVLRIFERTGYSCSVN